MKPDIKQLLLSMVKIGLIGFGGGSALIPVIDQEVVKKQRIISSEEYNKDIIVANITPGALPVELAGQIGQKVSGAKGMLAAASMMALPGAVMTLLLLSVLSNVNNAVLAQVEYIAVGVTAFIMCLLGEYIHNSYLELHSEGRGKKALLVIALVFAFTTGKNLIRIFQLDNLPMISLSTLDVLVISFYIIIVGGCNIKSKRTWMAVLLCIFYMACSFTIIDNKVLFIVLKVFMLVTVVLSLGGSLNEGAILAEVRPKEMVRNVVACIVFFIVLAIPAIMVDGDAILFAKNAWISSALSFGGGDAYLTVADGLFVSTGMLSEDLYYGMLVPVVNVLPGSILCKTLTGIGYYIGFGLNGSTMEGMAFSVLGFACSVAASCAVVVIVRYIYEKFENLDIFRLIKRWIRPIISGLLLTVITSLIYQNVRLGNDHGNTYIYVVFMLVILSVDILLSRFVRMRRDLLICISVGLSLALCNLY